MMKWSDPLYPNAHGWADSRGRGRGIVARVQAENWIGILAACALAVVAYAAMILLLVYLVLGG